MEGNRSSYTEDAQHHIRRQRLTIDKINFDNTQLKTELHAQQSSDQDAPGPGAQAEILRLGDFADLYTRKIEMERRRVEELDNHLALSDAKIVEQRRALGGADAAKDGDQQIEKQTRVLENKLDKTLTQFNQALVRNFPSFTEAGDCLSIHLPIHYTHTRRLKTDTIFFIVQGSEQKRARRDRRVAT
jgi:hypothetical protein